jgi:RNA polymerase sigma-70 factor (ECF subfamily)
MKSSPETRYTLIGKLRDPKDAEAWAEFTSIYQPLIFRICRARGLQHADATDVTQEVLAKIADVIDRFDHTAEGANFRGWLYRVTRNLVMDFFRHQKKDLLVQADVAIQLADDKSPTKEESAEFQVEFQRQIFWLVAQNVRVQVKPATWDAFWQTEVQRRPVKDVAKELNMTTGSIYVARSRVIARLKKEVEKRLSETSDYLR